MTRDGAAPDENEIVDGATNAVADGGIRVANDVIPLPWLALNRERLRAAWRAPG